MKKMSRITLDLPPEEHKYLKMACAKLGISMRQFLLEIVAEKLEALEDEWLVKKADEVMEGIESGKIKTRSWDDIKEKWK